MLDTDTKRSIDTVLDILVGKVPDPKNQVDLVDANRELIACFEKKSQETLVRVQGKVVESENSWRQLNGSTRFADRAIAVSTMHL